MKKNQTKSLINIEIENDLFKKGYKYIAGVDEVGRGPLAGPLVAAAVILDIKKVVQVLTNNDVSSEIYTGYAGINDSKKLSENKRCHYDLFIRNEAISYSIFEISNTEIDRLGIAQATQSAFERCVLNMPVKPDFIITDAFKIKSITHIPQQNYIHGDELSISIGAASIVAKVYRDALMTNLHTQYPQYNLNIHKGYGTRAHIEAIRKHGICELHRKSFEPIKSMINH